MTDEEWKAYRVEIFEATQQSTGGYAYESIADDMKLMRDIAGTDKVLQLAKDLLHEFHNRPALRWEFEQLLNDQEKTEYQQWRAQAKPRPTLQCTGCGSNKVLRIVYGMFARESKEVIMGGCMVSNDRPTHQCTSCGKEYRYKPIMKRTFT